jgi:hypothetical protein
VRGTSRPYPCLRNWDEARQPHIQWLRENPHRISLGRVALHLAKADGTRAAFADLSETRQTLDLWTGRLESRFVFDGAPVEVETSVHPTLDAVVVRLRSPLIASAVSSSCRSRRRPPAIRIPPTGRIPTPQTTVRRRDARTLSLDRPSTTPLRRHRSADRPVEQRQTARTFRVTARGGGR